MQENYIICHYGEIALKGKNRSWFENTLRDNISHALILGGVAGANAKRYSGRIIVTLQNSSDETVANKLAERALGTVFGITSFALARMSTRNIDAIGKIAHEFLRSEEFDSFAIDTRRSDKTYELTSQQVNERVGQHIVNNMQKRVDLENPDVTAYIEIIENGALVYTKKVEGLGGLPVGTSGKALTLISGGIDSPVASYMMMKRGIVPIYIHFHSMPYTSRDSLDKARELVKTLTAFHPSHNTELYLIPLVDIQKNIVYHAPEELRVLLYRRFMIRIAQIIARKVGAHALITGESLGQVASQTLENIAVVDYVANMPIFRPLIGFDKQEIVDIARKIDTYKTSTLPHDDCCALFEPKHPETKADLESARKAEEKLDIETLVDSAINLATHERYPRW